MAQCSHDCSSCGSTCGEDTRNQGIQKAPMNPQSKIKKVIGVVSGKGGVGKSSVTAMLASLAAREGKKVAILDADITGPSMPQAFGLDGQAQGNDTLIMPEVTEEGIKVMSINLLLEDKTDPVVWRGPILGGIIQQFWSNVIWGDIDIMFVDMPPGTGDVALTVYQSLPVDGIIIVTSPQQLVSMIVQKAVKMADMMDIPILALVENFAYYVCSNCSEKHYLYGESHSQEIAKSFGIENFVQLPIDPQIPTLMDGGKIEEIGDSPLLDLVKKL